MIIEEPRSSQVEQIIEGVLGGLESEESELEIWRWLMKFRKTELSRWNLKKQEPTKVKSGGEEVAEMTEWKK